MARSIGVRPVLVTGGAGFIGSNLADRLASEGHDVLVLDTLARPGVAQNLAWLKRRHPRRISAVADDIRDGAAVAEAVTEACAVFHLAGQVAVTTSLLRPDEDFAVNLHGTLMLLEALRQRQGRAPLLFASTNKVYGNLCGVALEQAADSYQPNDPAIRAHGIDERQTLDFHTPYGCSKGAADQYVLDYGRSFGLPTVVMRMSCIYGPRQMGTEDQGWVAHFLIRALAGEPISIYGDGRQVRDVLYVNDVVEAYLAAWRRIREVTGRAYNIGGGPDNAVSLRQLIAFIEQLLGRHVETEHHAWRAGDQRYYVTDNRRAWRDLGLAQTMPWRTGVTRLAEWLQAETAPRHAQIRTAPRPAEAVP
jgi:CDP-paratose 2-epimerase